MGFVGGGVSCNVLRLRGLRALKTFILFILYINSCFGRVGLTPTPATITTYTELKRETRTGRTPDE